MSLLRDRTSKHSRRKGNDKLETSGGKLSEMGDHTHTHKWEEIRRSHCQPVEGVFK